MKFLFLGAGAIGTYVGGSLAAAGLARTARHFDGWFPTGPDADGYARHLRDVRRMASEAGRDGQAVTAAIYVTVALDEDAARAEQRIDDFLQSYYGVPAHVMRARQACFAGPEAALGEWLDAYARAGAEHIMLRFAGSHEQQLEACARVGRQLGWL